MGNASQTGSGSVGVQLQFFSQWQEFRFPKKHGNSCPGESYRNIDTLIGVLISTGKATLHELKTVYTLQDAYQLYEIAVIDYYNEQQAMERARERAKRK